MEPPSQMEGVESITKLWANLGCGVGFTGSYQAVSLNQNAINNARRHVQWGKLKQNGRVDGNTILIFTICLDFIAFSHPKGSVFVLCHDGGGFK